MPDSDAPSPVTTTWDGSVMHIHLTRERKLNAFDSALVEHLRNAFDEAERAQARLVTVRGSGKGFSGGFDLDGLDTTSDGDMLLRFVRVETLLQSVFHAPFATLALVHGACFGAAADLVAACHERVAAPGSRFRMPGPKFNVILGTRRLTNLVGPDNARELLLRGGPFDEHDALRAGFIERIAPSEQWDEIIERAAARARQVDATTYRALTRRIATDSRDADLAALVRSVSEGSITQRLRAYVQDVRKAQAAKSRG